VAGLIRLQMLFFFGNAIFFRENGDFGYAGTAIIIGLKLMPGVAKTCIRMG